MYFDALTLAAITDELRSTILGGRVQRVLLSSPLSIGLEVYSQRQRYQVIASAHPKFARVHLVQRKPSRGVEQATPLLLLLRKYVLGAHITAIDQLPLERILIVSIAKPAESCNLSSDQADTTTPASAESADPEEAPVVNQDAGEMIRCELIIEPMERRSNIILVDDNNLILESIKRVTPRMSSRVILPRQPYEVPPAQDKRDPRTATADGIQALRELGRPDLTRALVAGYRGISPQLAREVVYRALGRTAATLDEPLPWEAVAHHLRELFTADWQPTLVSDDEAPLAYAPYKLTHMSDAQPQPTISAALEAFYAAREGLTAHQQRRDAVRQPLEAARQRLQHQRDQIMAELEHTENLEMLRWEGEMIFAFLHTITPGQTALEVEGHTITLDPEKGPVECAQARFRRYHKARSGHESLQERLRTTDGQLAGIEQLLALLEVADEREQIDQIAFEAEEQQYITPARKKQDARAGKTSTRRRPPRRKPLHLVSSDGFDMYVGRSATQNDEVTFRIGRPDDLWLHVRGIPGAHVIVRSGRQDVPEQTLREAGGVAAYFSGARNEPAVDIEISHRRHVRKISGGTPGLVTYRAERTLRVSPLPPWG